MWGTGYLHRDPTLLDRAGSRWRSRRVGESFTPTKHPPFLGLFRQFGGPWDQSIFNACTGYATSMAMLIAAEHRGIRLPRLSPLLPYWAARCRDAADELLITDSGAYVDDVVWAYNRFGAPDARTWPFDGLPREEQVRRINARPTPGAFRSALAIRHLSGRMRLRPIIDSGPRLTQRIAHSLHLEQVVLVALPVGSSFAGGLRDPIPAQSDEYGYHYVPLLDWREGSGGYEALIGNSWGRHWGSAGVAWASSALLEQAIATHYLEVP